MELKFCCGSYSHAAVVTHCPCLRWMMAQHISQLERRMKVTKCACFPSYIGWKARTLLNLVFASPMDHRFGPGPGIQTSRTYPIIKKHYIEPSKSVKYQCGTKFKPKQLHPIKDLSRNTRMAKFCPWGKSVTINMRTIDLSPALSLL